MRENKFKAWNKKEKKWTMPLISQCGKITLIEPFNYQKDTEGNLIEIEVIQYIGRKDKNDKEIWERDIIEITALTGAEGLAPGFVFNKLRVEVRWDDENALWSFNLDADYWEYYDKKSIREMVAFRNHVRTLMFDGETGEVIGNKFENPELLKSPKNSNANKPNLGGV